MTLSSQENTLFQKKSLYDTFFYSCSYFRAHPTTLLLKILGGGCMGHPPPQILGGTVPPVPPRSPPLSRTTRYRRHWDTVDLNVLIDSSFSTGDAFTRPEKSCLTEAITGLFLVAVSSIPIVFLLFKAFQQLAKHYCRICLIDRKLSMWHLFTLGLLYNPWSLIVGFANKTVGTVISHNAWADTGFIRSPFRILVESIQRMCRPRPILLRSIQFIDHFYSSVRDGGRNIELNHVGTNARELAENVG